MTAANLTFRAGRADLAKLCHTWFQKLQFTPSIIVNMNKLRYEYQMYSKV